MEQMKKPSGAVPDSFSYVVTYKKNGKELEFNKAHHPDEFD